MKRKSRAAITKSVVALQKYERGVAEHDDVARVFQEDTELGRGAVLERLHQVVFVPDTRAVVAWSGRPGAEGCVGGGPPRGVPDVSAGMRGAPGSSRDTTGFVKLYYAPNTCALASQIALEDAGASYELARVDFQASEQRSAAYLTINPKGRVPALVTERGILTETPAILLFIAQAYPEAQLAPLGDAFALAEVNSFMAYLCSTVHVAHAHRMRGTRWVDDAAALEAMRKKVPEKVGEAFGLIEREMLRGPWVMGERYTIADPYLFTLAQWLEVDGVDPATLPRVAAHRARMAERPTVKKAIAMQSHTAP